MLLAVSHSDKDGWSEVHDLSTLSDLRAAGDQLLWAEADVVDLGQDDVALIADEFELHPLAVEDAVHTRQRPKVETYRDQLFVVLHQLDEIDGQLEALQLACFIGDRYLLVIHAGARRMLEEAKRRWEQRTALERDPWALLHTLLDVVVDDYQETADRLEAEIEELEEIVLTTPRAPIQRQLYSLKQRVSRLRRYVLPTQRIVDWVVRPDADKPLPEDMAALFRDVHDHLLRISDQIRNVDDLGQAVIDLSQAQQAIELNVVSRKLTAWAAIFAVGTLIAGIYGMNFTLVPRDQTLFGFWFAVGLMAVAGVALYIFFKRKDWL